MDKVKVSEKIKAILKDIESKDEKKIIKGLRNLKINGNETVIYPVIKLWSEGVSDKVEKEIISILQDVKVSSSASIFIQAIKEEEFGNIQTELLNIIWNSDVDYSDYLIEFVQLSIEKDFLTTFECLTIIENLKGPFEEAQILESEIKLKEFLSKRNENEASEKLHFIGEISRLIKSFGGH